MAFKSLEERRIYAKKHYRANKEQYNARNRRKRARVREYVRSAKEKPCMDCGASYPYYVMDFDHRGDKKYQLNDIERRHSLRLAVVEIAKCDVVCSNCHRERTYQRARDKAETSLIVG